MKVFIGGSKNINTLSDSTLRQIDVYRSEGYSFLIGDCYGVDLCVQRYFAEVKEDKITIYCSGDKPRNNVGEWDIIALHNTLNGFASYRQKDIAMAQDCDCGYMIWDGVSKGTAANIFDLKHLNKPVKVELVK